jgi:L-lactate utilization protein LutB
MVSLQGEMASNRALEAAGIERVETDLGEYILQIEAIRGHLSHIVAPVSAAKTRSKFRSLLCES